MTQTEIKQLIASANDCAAMLEKNTNTLIEVTRQRDEAMRLYRHERQSRQECQNIGILLIAVSAALILTLFASKVFAGPITDTVVAWSGDECGRYCTDERRSGAEDRSSYIVGKSDAYELEIAIIHAIKTYPNVPIEVFLATAWHESSFQRYAVGPGGECGMFQQLPRYMRPADVREELQTYEARCDWLQDIHNSVMAFAENASEKIDRFGDDWSCAYNQGSSDYRSRGYCNADGADYRDRNTVIENRIRRNLRVFGLGSS